MQMQNPWLDIPLNDYEEHMSLPSIAQSELLAAQLARLLSLYAPESVAVLGCAGGNGFDCISSTVTKRIIGVDINHLYIDAVFSRYGDRFKNLELYISDIQDVLPFDPVDFVYAALVFEYVELKATFQTLQSICKPGGVLATLLQLPSPSVNSISPSPFTSLQSLGSLMKLVPPHALEGHAQEVGFSLLESRQLPAPSGKKFALRVFKKR